MTNTVRDGLLTPLTATKDLAREIPAIFELSDEDTDLVGGGPEVINDPNE